MKAETKKKSVVLLQSFIQKALSQKRKVGGGPIKLRPDLRILDESIVVELTLSRKRLFIAVIYRSPSQNSNEYIYIF